MAELEEFRAQAEVEERNKALVLHGNDISRTTGPVWRIAPNGRFIHVGENPSAGGLPVGLYVIPR